MDKKINIAIIAGQLVVGGAERQLYLWLTNLDRDRFNPIVLTLHPGHHDYWEKPIEDLGISLYRLPHRNNRALRLMDILNILRPYQPRLIHGWHMFASAYAGMASKILSSKSIGGIRSSYRSLKNTWETRLSSFFCDAIISNSETSAKAYQANQKWKTQPVFTVQNAVDSQFDAREDIRAHLTHAYGLPADAIWIASIGRMDPLKRFDLLVRLSGKLKAKSLNFHWLIIGDGPEKEILENLSRELNVQDRVTFTGEVAFASRWMKSFDIFCFPSIDEGLPNVIMEAASAGLPVVAWQLPFVEELLESDKMALLVEPNDLDGMEDSLRALICSGDLRTQLGSAAQAHILSHFSLEKYIQGMTSVYETLLEE